MSAKVGGRIMIDKGTILRIVLISHAIGMLTCAMDNKMAWAAITVAWFTSIVCYLLWSDDGSNTTKDPH